MPSVMAQPYHHLCKILVVGDPSVGKEDLLKKFEEDKHSESPFVSTIGEITITTRQPCFISICILPKLTQALSLHFIPSAINAV